MAYEIRENLTQVNYTPRGTPPSWITIHNTANGTSAEGTAHNNTQYFKSVNRNASAHLFVDDGDVVWRCVADTDTAWHCGEAPSRNGCTNYNSIGIEVCERADGAFSEHEIRVLQWLVPMLMGKYGIPAERVCRHHDVTGKDCPWRYSDDSRWAELKARILSGTGESEGDMQCIFQPNGEGYLVFYDGSKCHPLSHPDEVEAINMVYKATHGGASIPMFSLGSAGAPWATRFMNAVERG